MEFFRKIVYEATQGNFSFAILIASVVQIVIMAKKRKSS
jgi:hypothetical protein